MHWSHDVTPYAAARDRAVRGSLEADRVAVHTHPGVLIHDAGTVLTGSGDPYRVFTPFHATWRDRRIAPPLDAPKHVSAPRDVIREALPTATELEVSAGASGLAGGETAALRRLDDFLAGAAEGYEDRRDLLAEPGTSRLSADLHYGTLSPRAAYTRLDRRGRGHRRFATELTWRDFYGHVLAAWPEVASTEFNPGHAGTALASRGCGVRRLA